MSFDDFSKTSQGEEVGGGRETEREREFFFLITFVFFLIIFVKLFAINSAVDFAQYDKSDT